MSQAEASKKTLSAFVKAIVVSIVFGAIARVIVEAHLTIPIPGTGVVTDPREIFTTIGAGLSGPIGGMLIGVLAGIRGADRFRSLEHHVFEEMG